MSPLAINSNILVVKNENIRNGVYLITNKKDSSDGHYRFAVDGLPNTFVYLVKTSPSYLTKTYTHYRKVLVVDDEDKFIADLNRVGWKRY